MASSRDARELLPHPKANRTEVVEQPVRTGPFTYDVLGSIFLFFDDYDLWSLMAVSSVCHYWRGVANLLPQWEVVLHRGLPERTEGEPRRDRDECVRELKEEGMARIKEGYAWSCFELTLFFFVCILTGSTLILWILTLAQLEAEWPATTNKVGDESYSYSMSRVKGYPGFCRDSMCMPMRDVIMNGIPGDFDDLWVANTTGARSLSEKARWICPGNREQMHKFETAATLELVGLSFHVVFLVVALMAVKTPSSHELSSMVVLVGLAGLTVCAGLLIASLAILQQLATTPCSPSAPTAEAAGWERENTMMLLLICMTLVGVVVYVYLFLHERLWIALQLRNRRKLHRQQDADEADARPLLDIV